MNRIISPCELSSAAQSIISYCDNKIDSLVGLLSPIGGFTSENFLSGLAWSAARGRLSARTIVIQGTIVAYDSMREDAYKLQAAVADGGSTLDERVILEGIELTTQRIQALNEQNANWSRMASSMPATSMAMTALINANQEMINDYIDLRTKMNERLQKLERIDHATQSLFTEAAGLFADVSAGVEHITDGGEGLFSLPWSVGTAWRTNLQVVWFSRRARILGIEGKIEIKGFRELNQEFWDRNDGFFDGFWWQCPDKFQEAFEVLLVEAELLNGIDLKELARSFHSSEVNLRLITLQELTRSLRTGQWDSSLHTALEILLADKNVFYGDLNHTLDVDTLRWLRGRHDERVWGAFSHWLERGGEGVLLGGMVLAGGFARTYANKPVTTGPKETGSGSVGNFQNVKDLNDFNSRIPLNAIQLPWKNIPGGASNGVKYKWTDNQGNVWNVRAHSRDPGAPAGSNANQGWVYRVEVRWGGSGKTYYMDSRGNFHPQNVTNPRSPMYNEGIANDTHIPFTP